MDDTLERRIEALERAVTDDEHDLSALATAGETAERLDALDSRLESIEDRVAELEAATQAVRGYVGNVRSVNRDIEQRADAALARVESLEAAVADESDSSATATSPTSSADHREEADAGGATASTPGGTASNEGSNTGERARGAGGTTGAGATGSGSGLDTGTDPASDGTGGGHHCEACGRPTPEGGTDRRQSSPGDPGAERTGGGNRPAGPRANGATGASAQAKTGPEALDPEFRAENGDDAGAFERIRRLL
jgi:hypothetical protein